MTYKDYPASYTSCGYSGSYGGLGDYPFRVDAPFGTPDLDVVAAVNAISGATGGSGGPESYARFVWELSQPGSSRSSRAACCWRTSTRRPTRVRASR